MTTLPIAQQSAEIDQFLKQLKTPTPGPSIATGRLVFALDATASRQPTWDQACHLQNSMFEATAGLGRLDVQLVYYRGYSECKTSRWLSSAALLHQAMHSVHVVGGRTQIGRVLEHALHETKRERVNALIFVGDAMEEEADRLCALAGELGKLDTPIFIFQEGTIPAATSAFRQIAQLSHGAHLSFDLAAIDRLKQLLAAVAVYAAGGLEALENYGKKTGGEVLQLSHRLQGTHP
jgi:hypothetical protein